MTLGDVIVSKDLTDDQIRWGIAAGTGLGKEAIQIVSDIIEAARDPATVVLCEKTPRAGDDFPMQLSFYVAEAEFDAQTVEKVLATFCAVCDCDILVSDDGVNPYMRILITSTGEHRLISLDAEKLDERDEFVVERVVKRL